MRNNVENESPTLADKVPKVFIEDCLKHPGLISEFNVQLLYCHFGI